MAKYQPPHVKTDSSLSGQANVKVKRNDKKEIVKVMVEFDPAIVGAEDHYVLDKGDCPDYVMPGQYIVTLSGKGDKMYSMRPIEGLYVGKVQKYVAAKDKEPAPKTINVKPAKGNAYSFEAFTVLLEVTRGKEKGMVIPYNLRYHYAKADFEGKAAVGYGHLKSKYTATLEEFDDVAGTWERGPMPFKDNVLPQIEKRVLREDKEFNILMKNGWVDKVFPLQAAVVSEKLDELEPEEKGEPEFEDVTPEAGELPWDEAEAE